MARKKSFITLIAQASREGERNRQRQIQRNTKLAKEAERAQKAYLRAQEQKIKADEKTRKAQEKEAQRLYIESRIADTDLQNEQLEQEILDLESVLVQTLKVDDYIDFASLKKKLPQPQYIQLPQKGLHIPLNDKPLLTEYMPKELTAFQKLIPGAQKKYEKEVYEAKERFQKALSDWNRKEDANRKELEDAKKHNDDIDQLQRDFIAGDPNAIVNYFSLVLEASSYPDDFPQEARLAYVPESKQLVVEYDLPPFEIVPQIASYKYVKTRDDVTNTKRLLAERKSIYASLTAQVTLRTIHELFEADRSKHLETIVFSGFVESVDRATGKEVRTCLISVRTTRDVFDQLDLSRVDPILCLKNLNAAVSKNPDELVPVRPVLEFNMVDRRYIQEVDVLSTLDQRPNLMDLSPGEFESLITNLFTKMGLEAKLTQAARDGGVDCVAYDPRPILGGKVVIQAKRYKNVVGVSAVRDLFGTLHNEGASKGILVTTSWYGKAAFEFVTGKPIELLDGSNLLYLLSQHAGIEAMIKMPDDGEDPHPDSKEI